MKICKWMTGYKMSRGQPAETIIVVCERDANVPFEDVCSYWAFGPNTRYPWPSGDFHDRTIGIVESAWRLEHLLRQVGTVQYRYDPDLAVDEGL